MQELNEVLIFRVDKDFKKMMAKLKANHYNISSVIRSAAHKEMKHILESITSLTDESVVNKQERA